MLILRRVLKPQLVAAFIGIVCKAIIFTSYLFTLLKKSCSHRGER